MIAFACPECGKSLKAPDEAAGRDGRCSCGAAFAVPHPANPSPPRVLEYREPAEPDDETDAALERQLRHRRNRQARRRLILRLTAVGLLLVAVVVTVTAAANHWRRVSDEQAKVDLPTTHDPEPIKTLHPPTRTDP